MHPTDGTASAATAATVGLQVFAARMTRLCAVLRNGDAFHVRMLPVVVFCNA